MKLGVEMAEYTEYFDYKFLERYKKPIPVFDKLMQKAEPIHRAVDSVWQMPQNPLKEAIEKVTR